MKVEIKNNTEELPFPKLMITKDRYLVFFEKPKCGFRLDEERFYYHENWNMDVFTDFDGEVTLKNK